MNVYTKQQRIASLAKRYPDRSFASLAHYIDLEWLREAYRRTRKNAAPGVDGQTAREYAEHLEDNLRSLLDRVKSGRYVAPPVKRTHIPKDGKGHETRPIGIPTFEDKVLQRAVVMVLEPIYEQDFYRCSYGFRPGRSAHGALKSLWRQTMAMGGGWILDVDIRKFFDTLGHGHLRSIVKQRVCDGVLTRLISKWLHAGVLEHGSISYPEDGTPQGGVISPLLSNIYLHEVLDKWFVRDVDPWLDGRTFLVRYADDFVLGFVLRHDAERVLAALPNRFAKYGLTIHPEKTRLVRFQPPPPEDRGRDDDSPTPGTFDFLSLTHYWGKSHKGGWVVRQKTASRRLVRAIRQVQEWCKEHRHDSVAEQCTALRANVQGHYTYFGVCGNIRCLQQYYRAVQRVWRKWLDRRSRTRAMPWARFERLLARYPLPTPHLSRSYRTANP